MHSPPLLKDRKKEREKEKERERKERGKKERGKKEREREKKERKNCQTFVLVMCRSGHCKLNKLDSFLAALIPSHHIGVVVY